MNFTHRACLDELAVVFFFRVIDPWNSKVFRVRCQDWKIVLRRLGHANAFRFFQPENEQFEFDFSMYDQRVAANILCKLANKEPKSSLKAPLYVLADGSHDTLQKGIPPLWQKLDGIPTA